MTYAASGLQRLADAPALIHGRTVLTGADVLGSGPGDIPEKLYERLSAASTRPGDLVDRLRLAYGDGVRRVAVFGDFAGVAGDAALAAWAAGAAVVCGQDALSPARALALLERTGADRAFVPVGLLCALPDHPSAPLTDLHALRRVVHCDQPPPGDRISLAADALGVTVSHVPLPGSDSDDGLVEAAQAAAERGVTGIDLDAAVAAVGAVGRAALLSMLNALYGQEAGVRIAERHQGLVRRWRAVLAAEGLLRMDGERCHLTVGVGEFTGSALQHAWDEAEKAWRATVGSAGTVEYARRSARLLPELLAGTASAVSLLFPRGDMSVAESLYRESVTARYQHHAVGGLLGAIAARWPRHRPLRVLEVGAGTGATTERALPALTDSGAEIAYLFTDVTPFFLERARQRWGAVPGIGFGHLDIDTPAPQQGFAPGSFDVVLAGGVLNAARDTDASVRSLAGLLAPDGRLVLTEPTAEEYWVMITQAFLMADARDARARTGATFLSLDQWREVLDSAALTRVVDLPGPGHPLASLGHRVFAARRQH